MSKAGYVVEDAVFGPLDRIANDPTLSEEVREEAQSRMKRAGWLAIRLQLSVVCTFIAPLAILVLKLGPDQVPFSTIALTTVACMGGVFLTYRAVMAIRQLCDFRNYDR